MLWSRLFSRVGLHCHAALAFCIFGFSTANKCPLCMYVLVTFHALASYTHLQFTGRTMLAHEPVAMWEVLFAWHC